MKIKKRRLNLKEQDQLQKVIEENQRLKKQISKLRKVIKNIDIEHYQFVQDLLNSKTFKENPIKTTKKELEKQWECHQCSEGIMRLIIVHKLREPYYFRKCDNCTNKTKLKKYDDSIKGA